MKLIKIEIIFKSNFAILNRIEILKKINENYYLNKNIYEILMFSNEENIRKIKNLLNQYSNNIQKAKIIEYEIKPTNVTIVQNNHIMETQYEQK
jgi:coenzyme F420-reducing hydrogenase delta subunit